MKSEFSNHPITRHDDDDAAVSDQGDPELPTYAESAVPLPSSAEHSGGQAIGNAATTESQAQAQAQALSPESSSSSKRSGLPASIAASHSGGPTVSEPFNFPSVTEAPPSYSVNSPDAGTSRVPAQDGRPIAIPQIAGNPQAPFLSAFAPSLLNHGIPAETWYAFLDTMSAFLTARVSSRALKHAGDIAASIGNAPVQLGKDIADTAKATAKGITSAAKRGDIGGVIAGVIGGTVALTTGTAIRTTGTLLSLPSRTAQSAASPKTPRERVEAYAAAVNKEWLHPRGLHMQIMAMSELSKSVGLMPFELLDLAGSAAAQLLALRHHIDDLQIREPTIAAASAPGARDGASALRKQSSSSRWGSFSSQSSSSKQGTNPSKRPAVAESSSTGSLYGEGLPSSSSSAMAAGQQELSQTGSDGPYLSLSPQTLWVVVRKQ